MPETLGDAPGLRGQCQRTRCREQDHQQDSNRFHQQLLGLERRKGSTAVIRFWNWYASPGSRADQRSGGPPQTTRRVTPPADRRATLAAPARRAASSTAGTTTATTISVGQGVRALQSEQQRRQRSAGGEREDEACDNADGGQARSPAQHEPQNGAGRRSQRGSNREFTGALDGHDSSSRRTHP